MTFPCKVVINSHTKYFVWVNVLKNDFMYFNIKSGLPICETLFFVETNMTFDLLQLMAILFSLHHFPTSSATICNLASTSFTVLPLVIIAEPSAYRSTDESMAKGRSLRKIMNNKGPRTDPWGTPKEMKPGLEVYSLKVVLWIRLVR